MVEKDFTCNIKINGQDELNEVLKKARKFVQILKEAQELIEYLSEKTGYDVKVLAERLIEETEYSCRYIRDEIQEIEDQKEKLDIPREILKLIFDKYPEGVTVGEIMGILKEAQQLLDDTLIV